MVNPRKHLLFCRTQSIGDFSTAVVQDRLSTLGNGGCNIIETSGATNFTRSIMRPPTHQNILIVTEDQIAKVRQTYNLTQEDIDKDVDYLVDWYKTQPHLPMIDLDRVFAEQMLLRSKYSMEKTKQFIDNFYSHFDLVPEFYADRDPQLIMKRAIGAGAMIPMPRVDNDAVRTMIIKFGTNDEEYSLVDIYRFSRMMAEYKLMRDYSLGERYIYDLANVTPRTFLKLNIMLIKKLEWVQKNAFGTKLLGFHLLNAGAFFDKLMSLVKPVFKPKLVSRIHFHKDLEDLHKYVPKEVLPTEYGGCAGSFDDMVADWSDLINTEEYQEWFRYHDSLRSDESKRPGKTVLDDSSLMGVPGTFRQIKID